jgi:hypothetical protein
MKLKWIDRLGDLNPQLMREIQEIRISHLLIATIVSLLGQFLLIIFFQSQLPLDFDPTIPIINKYCLTNSYCLRDSVGFFVIHWQLWWANLFTILSILGVLILLVGGVYLLVYNLANEQRRGTLNFIRLSPQPPQIILSGKLLGVPSLLFLVAILAIPLHLYAGLSAEISLFLILEFYIFLLAGCFFFYSTAILFGLVSSSCGFAPWLASGAVLLFLLTTHYSVTGTLVDWLFLFSPMQIISYLIKATHLNLNYIDGGLLLPTSLYSRHWYNVLLGANAANLVMSALLNYSLCSYWIWQAIKRCYSHPQKTLLNKQQSYLLLVFFETVIIGFTVVKGIVPAWKEGMIYHYRFLLMFNWVMFLALILFLKPSRQGIQSDARYHHGEQPIQNLVWSSVLSVIVVNLAIASIFLVSWILFSLEASEKIPALFSLLICYNFILFCAVITQIITLRIVQKPALWITGVFAIVTILPVIVLNLLARNSSDNSLLWLFTPYAWVVTQSTSQVSIWLVIVMQWSILGLCTLQLMHNIKKIGESASK